MALRRIEGSCFGPAEAKILTRAGRLALTRLGAGSDAAKSRLVALVCAIAGRRLANQVDTASPDEAEVIAALAINQLRTLERARLCQAALGEGERVLPLAVQASGRAIG